MTDWNTHTIRELERASIRSFVERNRQYLKGRVLDFGCGRPGTCAVPQPYRDLVEGEYLGYDLGDRIPVPPFDAILCTQVVQYMEDVPELLRYFHAVLTRFGQDDLSPSGHLVLTYPTNWDEVESFDLWRFTKTGMEMLLKTAGFKIVTHERRAEIDLGGFKFPLGYGVVAQK
jgi:SAM-dependent methyltransferase